MERDSFYTLLGLRRYSSLQLRAIEAVERSE